MSPSAEVWPVTFFSLPSRMVRLCRWLEAQVAFDLAMAALIVISILILAIEVALPPGSQLRHRLFLVEEAITGIFILELMVRYLAMRRRNRFLREYWLDILAILPLLRIFRFARFVRLLRLLRLFRLAQMLTSHSRFFDYLLRRRAGEYVLMGLLVGFTMVAGTLGMAMFEHPHGASPKLLENSLWVCLFTLFSGEYSTQFPDSVGGRMTVLLVQFASLGMFAVMTGTMSAVMIEKLREGAILHGMVFEDMEDHVILCGWSSGLEKTLMELQSSSDYALREFVVVADRETLPDLDFLPARNRIHLMRADFTRVESLQRANVMKASVAIIVSDIDGHRTRQDADARTVLAALTIEKLNPSVYTIAELSNAMNEPHLRMGNVNEVIVSRDVTGHMLAQAALHSANSQVLHELIRSSQGANLEPHPVPAELAGREFGEILSEFRLLTGAIPIAVQDRQGAVSVNPTRHVLESGDCLLCIGCARRTNN
ncbi:MAG: ion transporter [Candidatus Eremiobacteraeota bacterium]|nr:ion transporter [Candidatus Eremiobacteraeota bacterium]MCW5870719.1 ion transporter [Candidatus Eremiobacteraeota bacterium]